MYDSSQERGTKHLIWGVNAVFGVFLAMSMTHLPVWHSQFRECAPPASRIAMTRTVRKARSIGGSHAQRRPMVFKVHNAQRGRSEGQGMSARRLFAAVRDLDPPGGGAERFLAALLNGIAVPGPTLETAPTFVPMSPAAETPTHPDGRFARLQAAI